MKITKEYKLDLNAPEYEFQSLSEEVSKYFKKNCYWLPHKEYWTDSKARRALDVCYNKGQKSLDYFIGILKK